MHVAQSIARPMVSRKERNVRKEKKGTWSFVNYLTS